MRIWTPTQSKTKIIVTCTVVWIMEIKKSKKKKFKNSSHISQLLANNILIMGIFRVVNGNYKKNEWMNGSKLVFSTTKKKEKKLFVVEEKKNFEKKKIRFYTHTQTPLFVVLIDGCSIDFFFFLVNIHSEIFFFSLSLVFFLHF